jgi:hypothetical protein
MRIPHAAMLAAMLAAACGAPPRSTPPGATPPALARAPETNLRIVVPPGAPERTTVVHRPPEVWALWIPDHLERAHNMVIGGHYVYVLLRPGEFRDPQGIGTWYVEDLDGDLDADGMVTPDERAGLETFLATDDRGRWINAGAITPYREEP